MMSGERQPVAVRYVVYSPPFDPNSGGVIFLHRLVHELNALGEEAVLTPADMASIRPPLTLRGRLSRAVLRRAPKATEFSVNPAFDTPVEVRPRLEQDTVVLYPEIVRGNPLKARNVVRWLLYHDPAKTYHFGRDDMFFRVDRNFDHPGKLSGGAPDLFLYEIHPAYRDEGRSDRKGACYMVRKGYDKPPIPETENALLLDGKSHEEIARAFNRCEVFYSYDEATMYSQYAALCGCLSIVIPGNHASREEWIDGYAIARYGIAYGLDDVEHARNTMHLVRPLLEQREREGLDTVRNFVRLTRARFGAETRDTNTLPRQRSRLSICSILERRASDLRTTRD
jgi:hypothetical protein